MEILEEDDRYEIDENIIKKSETDNKRLEIYRKGEDMFSRRLEYVRNLNIAINNGHRNTVKRLIDIK